MKKILLSMALVAITALPAVARPGCISYSNDSPFSYMTYQMQYAAMVASGYSNPNTVYTYTPEGNISGATTCFGIQPN